MSLYENMLGRVTPYVRLAYSACHIILSFGSTVIIFLVVIQQGGKFGLSAWLTYPAAYLAANAWYSAIEAPLKRMILVYYAYRKADKETAEAFSVAQKATGKAAGWFMYLLLSATLALSLLVNVDFSEGLTEEKDSSEVIAQDTEHRDSYNNDVSTLREQWKEAKEADALRVDDAKSRRARMIADAEKSKGAEMYRLYKAGNGWAAGELKRAIAEATKKGDRLVAQAEAARTAPALQKQLTGYITTRSASRDTVATMTALIVTNNQQQYLFTVWRRFGALTVAVLFVCITYVQCGKYLVLVKLATGETEDEDNTPGIVSALKGFSAKANRWLGSKIQQHTDNRLQFAVATPTVKKQTETRQQTRQQETQTKTETKAQTKRPAQTKTKVVSVSASCPQTVSNVTVVFEGRQYSLSQCADKMRKWYSRAQAADKGSKTQTNNRQKYEAMKAETSQYFRFVEKTKAVKIEKR